jgi:hypothetical protein
VLAAQLLAAADLWLFVTSAARYADQVAVGLLRKAADRSAAVAIVLDRTPPEAVETVSTHLARMLASRGLKDSPLFTVVEGELGEDGLLPAADVAEIRTWLESLAADAEARSAVVKQTLDGAVRTLARRTHSVADAATEQVDAVRRLRDDANAAYDRAVSEISEASADGTLLRGEVLARWQEFVGTGELLRSLETRVGWLRDRVVNAIKGKPQQAERVTVAVESGLETLILEHAEGRCRSGGGFVAVLASGQILLADAGEDLAARRATSGAGPSAPYATGSRTCWTWCAPRVRQALDGTRCLASVSTGLSMAYEVSSSPQARRWRDRAEAGIAGALGGAWTDR